MATIASKFSKGELPIVTGDCAGDVVINDYFIDVTAAQIEADNLFDLGVLPAYHTVVDAVLIPDDLDTGTPAIVLDIGLMSGTPGDVTSVRTCGDELYDGTTAAQGGTLTRMTEADGFKILPVDYDRSIGVKVVTDAATAAAGRIRLRVLMAQGNPSIQF